MAEKKVQDNKVKAKKSVSGKLLKVLIPMIAASIILIMYIVAVQARNIITELATNNLDKESDYYSEKIGREITTLMEYCDASAAALESVSFPNDNAMASFLIPTLTKNEYMPNGMYVATATGAWIDPSGWVPDPDYVATERSWYQEGLQHSTFFPGEPYVDSDTGSMVVSFTRKVKLADAREGVASTDYTLDGIVEEIGSIKPVKTGGAMLLANDIILSYFKTDYNGTKVGDHPEALFLNSAYQFAKTGSTEVVEIKSENGQIYYVGSRNIPGTDWTLICSVAKNEVLSGLRTFEYICIGLMILMILIISVVLYMLLKKFVSVPVGNLTDNITRITDGDFTVDIPEGGDDEIGLMNNNMRSFVGHMRGTLGNIKDETEKLATEAENSKDASGKLNVQATEQSTNMNQIRDAMNGMASAVAELANNATELATEVTELMDKGNEASATVETLVGKARDGQRDMEVVQDGMGRISASMSDMNTDVQAVGESAQKINSIIEIINSIASQTNLLSLNASIEAARAGEAGKGFAVVAQEIGQLAANSAESTTEIGKIITEITAQIKSLSEKSEANMDEINASTEAVQTAGKTFEEIFSSLDVTSDTVKQMINKISNVDTIATSVAAISQEQSASTEEVTATTDNLAVSAQQVADESQGVDESATTVSSSAATIEDFVRDFKI
ncbi:methyl-accepting chemotaxis protein [Butyrivibrio sp. FCS014]|uniref:methyl-accepting chemotaxis protein n=1 Tax=Butyrivibrio sp. FCS014 TaxID=1408304 RepID=UPI0004635226|nr:methyl-accepting chemotaxis protein [Butyrivibrio sp. FCS014]